MLEQKQTANCNILDRLSPKFQNFSPYHKWKKDETLEFWLSESSLWKHF